MLRKLVGTDLKVSYLSKTCSKCIDELSLKLCIDLVPGIITVSYITCNILIEHKRICKSIGICTVTS